MDVIISWLNNALGWVFSFLPNSPFQSLIDTQPVADYLGYIAYFIDISFILKAFDLWLAAVASYYVVMAVLRWVKAIGNG